MFSIPVLAPFHFYSSSSLMLGSLVFNHVASETQGPIFVRGWLGIASRRPDRTRSRAKEKVSTGGGLTVEMKLRVKFLQRSVDWA